MGVFLLGGGGDFCGVSRDEQIDGHSGTGDEVFWGTRFGVVLG